MEVSFGGSLVEGKKIYGEMGVIILISALLLYFILSLITILSKNKFQQLEIRQLCHYQ